MCAVPNAEFNEKHWGAAVMAAGFLGAGAGLPPDAVTAMVSEAERLIDANASWFGRSTVGGASGDPGDPGAVVAALAEPPWTLNLLGHDTIFAALALRAMRDQPELATAATVEAIVCMVGFARTRGPGGPFPGWEDPAAVAVAPDDGFPEIETATDVAVSAATALSGVGTVYDGRDRGVVQHVLTHAHAVIELDRMGHPGAARAGIEAHRVYRKLLTRRPDDGVDPLPREADVPDFRSVDYWRQDLRGGDGEGDWLFGHVFKVALAWLAIEPLLPADVLRRARPMLGTAMTIT